MMHSVEQSMSLNEWHLQKSVLDVNHPVHGLFEMEGGDELEKRVVMQTEWWPPKY
jgi:hypothetical protein